MTDNEKKKRVLEFEKKKQGEVYERIQEKKRERV